MNRLVRVGAEALKPQKTGMKWLSPYVSRRKANVLRKRALRDGSYGSVVQDPVTGEYKGWDPTWDVFKAPVPRPLRPPKLHKNERNRAERAAKITAKLAEQDTRVAEMRKQKARTKNKEPGILGLISRINEQGKNKR